MKILKLIASNIKRLVAVEIVPNGDVVTIAGRNGQGKSSILDSIWWTLAGAGVIQGEPIRKGQDKARVRLELGDGHQVELIAERKFRKGGKSELTFTNADGSPTKLPPQAMADSLIGALSFDPLAFSRKKPREQFDELRKIANITVDVDELDRLNAVDYAKRTEINREAKRSAAAAELIVTGSVSSMRIDTTAILDEIEAAGVKNRKLTERAEKRRAFDAGTLKLEDDAAKARLEAAEFRRKADNAELEAAVMAKEAIERRETAARLDPVPPPVDVSELRRQLDEATAANKAEDAKEVDRQRRRELYAEVARLTEQADALTAAMEERESQKREAIQAVKLPVEGLGFGDGIVTYNGIPFDQAGTAERWRVCIAIAMAANPKLRVIRIDEGSLMDSTAMTILAEMAKDNDFSIWTEVVDESGLVGFVIEDGTVVSSPQSRGEE